jgi:dTDP-4-dehydrorhamnose 3,5-epimerase
MQVERLAIPEVMRITPPRFVDSRGHFSEAFSVARFAAIGIADTFIQDNQSCSKKGVVRGLHCQIAPAVQGKLVRVVHGSIWDVAVDVRHGSPTFGQHVGATLSAENGAQLWVPGGFLHGFVALEDDTEVLYKVTAPYVREAERGVRWDDPGLAIPWPVAREAAIVSEKDQIMPLLAECEPWFAL